MNEFLWLPNSITKGIKLPNIIFEEYNEQPYQGYYKTGSAEIVIVQNKRWEHLIPSTIAHEFKHFLQDKYSGRKLHTVAYNSSIDYEESIKIYFNSSWSEMDALLFEHKYAKNEINDWWLRKLI